LNETLWPDQALGRTLTGTEKTLDGMTRKHLVDFLHNNYVASSTLIVAAGNVDHKKAVHAVRRYASSFNQGKRETYAPAKSQQTWKKLSSSSSSKCASLGISSSLLVNCSARATTPLARSTSVSKIPNRK